MWSARVYYEANCRDAIEKALPYVQDKIFECWWSMPTVKIEDADDPEEFAVVLSYEREGADGFAETSEGHNAFDLVQAFFEGIMLGKEMFTPEH